MLPRPALYCRALYAHQHTHTPLHLAPFVFLRCALSLWTTRLYVVQRLATWRSLTAFSIWCSLLTQHAKLLVCGTLAGLSYPLACFSSFGTNNPFNAVLLTFTAVGNSPHHCLEQYLHVIEPSRDVALLNKVNDGAPRSGNRVRSNFSLHVVLGHQYYTCRSLLLDRFFAFLSTAAAVGIFTTRFVHFESTCLHVDHL